LRLQSQPRKPRDQWLTKRQREVLYFLHKHFRRFDVMPSHRDIAEHFGWNSSKAAQDHLRVLRDKGYIRIYAGVPRGIKLLKGAGRP